MMVQQNDLWLICTLTDYKPIDKEVVEECLGVAYNHLQFLALEFTFLSLVSESLPRAIKINLAKDVIKI